MSNVSGIIKSIQDIMRKDVGVDGDAQRISQLVWMFFLKIFDDRESELELLEDVSGLAKLTKYAEKLTAKLPATVERLAEALLQRSDQVSEVHLKERVAGSEAKVLCSAAELRLLSISNSQPMERKREPSYRSRPSSSSGTSEKTPPRK